MTTTTLANLAKPQQAQQPDVIAGYGSQQAFELMQRAAKLLSASELVPQRYRGGTPSAIGNCVIALEMANRINAAPLMVMQNLYVVHGTPGWSAQFLIATFNSCGRFTSIQYEFKGEEGQDEWACRAYSTEKATGTVIKGGWVSIAIAKAEGWYSKNGSKWQTMPQQMLMYRAAAWLVRAYAPELAMGFQTAEELQDQPEPPAPLLLDDIKGQTHIEIINKPEALPAAQPEPVAEAQTPEPEQPQPEATQAPAIPSRQDLIDQYTLLIGETGEKPANITKLTDEQLFNAVLNLQALKADKEVKA